MADDRTARPAGREHRYREGKNGVLVYVEPERHREIGNLAVDTDRSVQSLMEEAIDLMLGKHRRGKPAG